MYRHLAHSYWRAIHWGHLSLIMEAIMLLGVDMVRYCNETTNGRDVWSTDISKSSWCPASQISGVNLYDRLQQSLEWPCQRPSRSITCYSGPDAICKAGNTGQFLQCTSLRMLGMFFHFESQFNNSNFFMVHEIPITQVLLYSKSLLTHSSLIQMFR